MGVQMSEVSRRTGEVGCGADTVGTGVRVAGDIEGCVCEPECIPIEQLNGGAE